MVTAVAGNTNRPVLRNVLEAKELSASLTAPTRASWTVFRELTKPSNTKKTATQAFPWPTKRRNGR